MKTPISFPLVAAVGFSGASLVVACIAMTRPIPPVTTPPPLGVCVMLSNAFADTTVTATVEQAQLVGGVVSCETGSYVPVVPK